MKSEDIIRKALKRDKRQLRLVKPSQNLTKGHMKKADHNLIVMTDLGKLEHYDWVVIAAYYAMYHSVLSLLAKLGIKSRDHTSTVAVLEYLFSKEIKSEWIKKFNKLKDMKEKFESLVIDKKYINYFWKVKSARESVQYGISLDYKKYESIMKIARNFVTRIKLVQNGLNQKLIEEMRDKVKKLQKS